MVDAPAMMAFEMPRVRFWQFRKASSRLQALFREGKDTDWVASVPESMASFVEPYFARWRKLHPMSSVQLPDGSIVYWGAPRESITLIADRYPQPDGVAPPGGERRIGVRVPLACATWYETGSPAHKKTGVGRIIDMSSSGVSFTTESSLRRGTRVALHITWPVQLEGEVPVELFAAGKLVRTEQTRAALQYDRIAFRDATP